MSFVYSLVSELPDTLQTALQSIGYHRKDIELIASETVSRHVSGGQGYRGFCVIVNLSTGERKAEIGSWGGANMFNPNNAVDLDTSEYNIHPGFAVIKGSQGDKTFATIYLHTENIVKFLPAKIEMDSRDSWILYTFDALTSAGRKNEWDRHNDKPSENDLNRLAGLGYLKRSKNGATQITTDGKNALGRKVGQTINHPKSKW